MPAQDLSEKSIVDSFVDHWVDTLPKQSFGWIACLVYVKRGSTPCSGFGVLRKSRVVESAEEAELIIEQWKKQLKHHASDPNLEWVVKQLYSTSWHFPKRMELS